MSVLQHAAFSVYTVLFSAIISATLYTFYKEGEARSATHRPHFIYCLAFMCSSVSTAASGKYEEVL